MSSDYGDEPRAITAEELRAGFLDACRAVADFWADPANSPGREWPDRVRGALHSFLCIIDGVSAGMPAFDLLASPHPDDKQFCIDEGENWIEPGTVINDCMLHDELYHGMWEHLRGDRDH